MNEHTNGKGQEVDMASEQQSRLGRRDFLRRGAIIGAVAGTGSVAGGALIANSVSSAPGGGLIQLDPESQAIDYVDMPAVRLMATDGHFSYPGRRHSGKPVFGFGFRAVDNLDQVIAGGELNASPGELISKYKGKVLQTAPTIVSLEGEEFAIVVTNLGLVVRPDLDDSHSLHWHGFRNATAVFDGVPETSISVPSGRDLPYFFHPKLATEPGQSKGSAGTYMYHCHFEDTEHVQMGMVGVVFIEPRDMWFEADGTTPRVGGRLKVAYNANPAGVDSGFDREFAFLMSEVDTVPHDNLEDVQEFVWSDYDPNYATINGRCYPDTIIPQITPAEQSGLYAETLLMPALTTGTADQVAEGEMKWQHNSALIQCTEGDRVLLRMANLGYEIHSIEMVGANDMTVIAHDASLLIGKTGTSDLTYKTRRIELGPGEARDAVLTAPAFDPDVAVADDLALRLGFTRSFNRYLLRSRNNNRNTNDGTTFTDGVTYAGADATYGGMVTEMWVYPSLGNPDAPVGFVPLPEQTQVNETYPTLVVPTGHV